MRHAYHWLTIFHQIAGLTLDEKVNITTGVGWMNGRCVVRSASSSRNDTYSLFLFLQLKFILYHFCNRVTFRRYHPLKVVVGPDYVCRCIFLTFHLVLSLYLRYLQDSPVGVRFSDFVTAFPPGINAAASFNREIMRTRGLFIGREHRGKGVNVALGPMMNMGRVAQGGRNWEGFGADPFLTGEAAYETILGMQQGGVMACAKHLIGKLVWFSFRYL